MSQVPDGYKIAATTDRWILESDNYIHWTVADLMEMLAECSPDARLWLMESEDTVRPLEGMGFDRLDIFFL